MSARLVSRGIFIVCVALIAAAAGDALVESISNTGLVGRGFDDNNHLSLIPTLIAGASLALLLIGRYCRDLLKQAGNRPNWLADIARSVTIQRPARDLPYIFALQLLALFLMESCEQLILNGKLLGGVAWLGGPIWFSLVMHALLALTFTILLAHAMRAMARRCALAVSFVLQFVLDAFAPEFRVAFARRHNGTLLERPQTVHVRQRGERAPPLLSTLT